MRKPILVLCTLATLSLLVMALPLATSGIASGGETGQVVDRSHPADSSHMNRHQTKTGACADCHKCENPTRKDPCLIPCPRYESHFFSQKRFEESPDVIIIDQLTDLYGPVVFAHRIHAEMGEMTGGCENCHHYSERDGEIPPCRQCHDAETNVVDLTKPALKGAYHRQCINCHLDWSHENACSFCHDQVVGESATAQPDTTDIMDIPHPMIQAPPTFTYETTYEQGPVVTFHHADHVDRFGQACVDCHRGDSCAACHDSQREEKQKAGHGNLDHLTSCCSCHGERDCLFCHKTEAMPEFEHAASTGWALAPYHTNNACTSCHGQPDSFRTPQTACTSCHIHWEDGGFNHATVGLVLDDNHIDNDCTDCHVANDFREDPACDNCHEEDIAYPAQLPGERTRR